MFELRHRYKFLVVESNVRVALQEQHRPHLQFTLFIRLILWHITDILQFYYIHKLAWVILKESRK